MVKLRLKRYGRKQKPTFRIIAIDVRCRRDGKALKEVGFYDPIKDKTQLNVPAILTLLHHGAKPTETVNHLLQRAGFFEKTNADVPVETLS